MSFESALDIVLAVLNFVAAAYLILRVRRLAGHLTVATIALGAFFGLRGVSRLFESRGVAIVADERIVTAIELLLVAALVWILATLEPVVRGLVAREDAARLRAEEYERARRHYTQVVRHRMMNPITTIKGGAQTLLIDHVVDPVTQVRILESIVEACDELEHVSLEPERRDDLERELDAVPNLDAATDRRRVPYPDGAPGPR